MNILGLNAYHGDSSACLLIDGEVVVEAEESSFLNIPHWAGFPERAIRHCLKEASVSPMFVHHVAMNRNPDAHLLRKVFHVLSRRPSLETVTDRWRNRKQIEAVPNRIASLLPIADPEVHRVEHHRAHLASAYFASPYRSAAVVSLDAFGDFASAMWGVGIGNRLKVQGRTLFPHSLGLFYLAMTQYLGFLGYGEEERLMDLSLKGRPVYLDKMRRLVTLKKDGGFALSLEYFLHHYSGISMMWESTKPEIGIVFSRRLSEWLGPPRQPEEPIDARHRDIAASVQAFYEEALFHVLNDVFYMTKNPALCLAGSCAANTLANEKITRHTHFKELFVAPKPGDAGGAAGAAFHVYHEELGFPRPFGRKEHLSKSRSQ